MGGFLLNIFAQSSRILIYPSPKIHMLYVKNKLGKIKFSCDFDKNQHWLEKWNIFVFRNWIWRFLHCMEYFEIIRCYITVNISVISEYGQFNLLEHSLSQLELNEIVDYFLTD